MADASDIKELFVLHGYTPAEISSEFGFNYEYVAKIVEPHLPTRDQQAVLREKWLIGSEFGRDRDKYSYGEWYEHADREAEKLGIRRHTLLQFIAIARFPLTEYAFCRSHSSAYNRSCRLRRVVKNDFNPDKVNEMLEQWRKQPTRDYGQIQSTLTHVAEFD